MKASLYIYSLQYFEKRIYHIPKLEVGGVEYTGVTSGWSVVEMLCLKLLPPQFSSHLNETCRRVEIHDILFLYLYFLWHCGDKGYSHLKQ